MFQLLPLIVVAYITRSTAALNTTCSTFFTPITATKFASALHPGWKPGNTMDAPHETDWGNPMLENSTFTNVKNIGFRGIRLQETVTWTYHMSDTPPYNIEESWLERVSEVIDMITSNDLYVLVNAHHDSWASFDLAAPKANYTRIGEKFYALWYQIGLKLRSKSHMVGFEPLNEPTGSTPEHAAELTKLQRLFVKAINDAGGHNGKRVVVFGGLGDSSENMARYFEPPGNISNPWALTFHYYGPWDFTALAWGKTIWGTETEKAVISSDFASVRANFSGVPIIVGEFGMEVKPSETVARWKWFDHIVSTGYRNNFTMMLWDASIHFVVGSPEPWQDPTALDVLLHAARGEENVLADSTEDAGASEQWSSAVLWHRVGRNVAEQSLPFIWNGRTLVAIRSSTDFGAARLLTDGTDFGAEGANITFKKAFLSTLFSEDEDATPEVKANLTLEFSGGADLQLQVVQWDTPQPSSIDFIVNASNAVTDLYVPFEYKGLKKLATVKARMYNSTYLFDEWTQWLGPLQQGRLVYQSHFDFNASGVIVRSSVLQAVLAANIATGLTFEFYPRLHANTVNFTIGLLVKPWE